LDRFSLGASYQYAVKIDHKFKQWSKKEFRFTNTPQKIMENATLTHKKKDKSRIFNIKKINPINWLRGVVGSLRKTLKIGVSSTKSLGTIPINVTQNNHWWSSTKKNNNNLT
jgi:SRSO17 transposase